VEFKAIGRTANTVESTAANAHTDDANFSIHAPLDRPGDRRRRHRATSPYRSVSDSELSLMQVCNDFICACIALPVALILFSYISPLEVNGRANFIHNFTVDSFFPVAVVISLAIGGIYRATSRRLQPSAFLEMRELGFGVGCGCALTLAIGALLHGFLGVAEPYPTQVVAAVGVGVVVITIGRMFLRYFLHALTTTRVLVVGSGAAVDRIILSVGQDPGMTLVGRVVDIDIPLNGALGRLEDLPQICSELEVHRILVAASGQFTPEVLDIYRALSETVHIAMVPRYFELISWRSKLSDLSGLPFLEIAQPHLSAWDQLMKRIFDIFVSGLILLITSPLLLAVAIGVKLSSPGPVFFRQVRLGRHGQRFTVNKFRSMTVEPDGGHEKAEELALGVPVGNGNGNGNGHAAPVNGHLNRHGKGNGPTNGHTLVDGGELELEPPSMAKDGPLHELRGKAALTNRITRFGAILRKTGLDEIPQFVNVFKGDMSVVGPRPFIPEESQVEGWATRRFDVRPGITGLWQVSGRNDLSRNDLIQLDYLYVSSWSLWWDLKIMFETPQTMLRGTGAY
jgi:exopolysaccharide biosynthesis polyprenyl glycosylphosphotransferase